jgi:hypothetical protein
MIRDPAPGLSVEMPEQGRPSGVCIGSQLERVSH